MLDDRTIFLPTITIDSRDSGYPDHGLIKGTVGGGVKLLDGFSNFYEHHPVLAEGAIIGVTAVLGGAPKTLFKRLAGEAGDTLIDSGANYVGSKVGQTVTHLAANYKWTIVFAIGGSTIQVAEASQLGGAANGLTSITIGLLAGQGADRIVDGYKGIKASVVGSARRNKPGVASNPGNLPFIDAGDKWFHGTHKNAARVPSQIAEELSGREFKNFTEFREEFWKKVYADENLRSNFDGVSLKELAEGRAPFAPIDQVVGKRVKYELDHLQELQNGGNVYDLGNIVIRTPLNHIKGK